MVIDQEENNIWNTSAKRFCKVESKKWPLECFSSLISGSSEGFYQVGFLLGPFGPNCKGSKKGDTLQDSFADFEFLRVGMQSFLQARSVFSAKRFSFSFWRVYGDFFPEGFQSELSRLPMKDRSS